MIRRPPRSTRTDTLFPYTTLVRSDVHVSRLGRNSAARGADLRPHNAAAHVPVRRAARAAGRGGPGGRSGDRKAEDAALVRGGLHGEHADVVPQSAVRLFAVLSEERGEIGRAHV